jgi:serine/threonine-protein kinase
MASYCYVCGSATPTGIDRATGEHRTMASSGVGPADLKRKLQRALGPGYELGERIGAGGFAEVFKARDLRLKRDLAVKVLRPDLGLSQEMMQRFRREAETIANLRNPYIVPVYDIGEGEGLAFIIMPFIAGESLRAILDRDGALPTDEVRRILREAASGLASAHEAGVVHRDIKPENIMLEGNDRRVLLMDFGIAKAVGGGGDDDPSAAALTTTGIIIGTPQYMSPEQACGDKTIDARSDQYSLAVVAYRMLSGVLPFEGDSTRSVLYKQLVADPPPIIEKVPGVPTSLAHAIQRALAKEPAERFPTMQEFAAMVDADSSLAPAAAVKAAQRKASKVNMAVLSLVAVLLAAVWYLEREPAAAENDAPASTLATAESTGSALATPAPAPGDAPAAVQPQRADDRRGGRANPASTPANRQTSSATPPPPPPAASASAPTCQKSAGAADWASAATACAKEAEGGSASAARILGTMYDKGNGVPQDPAQAVTWYRKGSAGGDFEAKFLLSNLVEIGRGTTSNPAEATALLRESAAGGYAKAQQVLAFRLENGAGIKKDEAEAAVWYRRLADRGDALAEQKMGDFLSKGRGISKNEADAITWWKKAADQGSGEAAWQLSQAYFKGKGTEKDEAAGMEWLRKAAGLNQPDAVKELKKREG